MALFDACKSWHRFMRPSPKLGVKRGKALEGNQIREIFNLWDVEPASRIG